MLRVLILILLLAGLAACSKPNHLAGAGGGINPAEKVGTADKYLAYEHVVKINTDDSKVATVYEAALAACRDARADFCTVLKAQINNGKAAYASLKFRMKPGGIQKIITALGKQAEITSQSTSAEDLAAPIDESAKKLSMLIDYRGKLQGLLGRAATDVDALIKVNRELAQVQSELEGITGQHAALMQRVETSTLAVIIESDHRSSAWSPISIALTDFGANLSQGVSLAITAIAYLIPWAGVFGVVAWGLRAFWHRRKRLNAIA